MATRHHSSVFICGHCGSEFTGRKRKYCDTKCRQKAAYQRKVERGIKGFTGKTRRPPNPIVDGQRVCLDCERNLPIEQFPVSKAAKSGYRGQCKACFAEFNRKRKDASARPERNYQMERIRAATHRGECGPPTIEQWRDIEAQRPLPRRHPAEEDIDRIAERNGNQAWQYLIKVKARDEWCRRYYEALGQPWRNGRLSAAERYRLKYRGDAQFQFSERMRRQINKAMKRDHVAELIRGAIKRGGESPTVERLLGYTISDLMDHIERQFTKGMTWDRMMAGEIHIDHITPKAAFDLTDDKQWQACWCLSNLRPCWARENLEKRDKQVFLL